MARSSTRNGRSGGNGASGVTAAQRKRYETVLRQLAEARGHRADGWDRYWELVAEVLSEGLFRAAGAASVQAWITQWLEEPYLTALRRVRVAQHSVPADEARYGVERLDAAIAYMELAIGPPAKGKARASFQDLRIPVSRRGKLRMLGLLEVAPEEIDAAIGLADASADSKPRGRGSSHEARLGTALRAVRMLRSVRPRSMDGHVSFGHLPLGQLEVALRALARVDWRILTVAPSPQADRLDNPVARAVVAREKVARRTR